MFVPTRAMCPYCGVMRQVLQDQNKLGEIRHVLTEHHIGPFQIDHVDWAHCLGSGSSVVMPNDVTFSAAA